MRHQFPVIAAVCAIFVGCAAEPERPAPAPEPETPVPTFEVIPDMIVAERGGFAPEGVETQRTAGSSRGRSPKARSFRFTTMAG